jgi:hypothetical protein
MFTKLWEKMLPKTGEKIDVWELPDSEVPTSTILDIRLEFAYRSLE